MLFQREGQSRLCCVMDVLKSKHSSSTGSGVQTYLILKNSDDTYDVRLWSYPRSATHYSLLHHVHSRPNLNTPEAVAWLFACNRDVYDLVVEENNEAYDRYDDGAMCVLKKWPQDFQTTQKIGFSEVCTANNVSWCEIVEHVPEEADCYLYDSQWNKVLDKRAQIYAPLEPYMLTVVLMSMYSYNFFHGSNVEQIVEMCCEQMSDEYEMLNYTANDINDALQWYISQSPQMQTTIKLDVKSKPWSDPQTQNSFNQWIHIFPQVDAALTKNTLLQNIGSTKNDKIRKM